MQRTTVLATATLAALAAVLAAGKPPGKPAPLFQLGTPDGASAEFGGSTYLWPNYLKVFPKPIVFTVGTSKLSDWPYIHPSDMDTWAGGKPHTFTIRFHTPGVPKQTLYFVIGITDACGDRPPLVTVAFNGHKLPPWRPPHGTARGALDPRTWAKPSNKVFPVPPGALRAGENTITIHAETRSWMTYDYLRLGTDPKPANLLGNADTLLEDFLAGPMRGVDEIVFAVRQPGRDGHWYANFAYYAPDTRRLTYGDGGKLARLNLRTGERVVLLNDPKGAVRDPQVHYDASKILFSYRKGGSPYHHLYEIGTDGTDLRQLTDGPFDDIEPTYLADDTIVFISSRARRWVNCWLTQVGILYRCDADGSHIRMISANVEHDNTPWPLPDGRLLYQRWEYVDRSQVHYHHLWTTNPDGTGQMVYYGNLNPGIVMIDAKPVPRSQQIVAIFSPGHGRREHDGVVTLVNPSAGPDMRPFARAVSRGADFRDPWAFTDECFLAARGTSLVVMNRRGTTQTIYSLPEAERKARLQVHEPRPIARRPRERRMPDRVKLGRDTGRLVLVNVTHGRNMAGVRPGEIKRLLVLETLPKPINFTGGMEPLSYGGTFTLERVLGTVPVEPDGSASMELPALRSLFFVALDADGLAVKRMQSFLTVMPGETTGCAGCHENRTDTPTMPPDLMALRRPPSRIEPIADAPDVLDFPRDVQPILDRHCVKCHGYDATKAGGPRSGGVVLTGDRGPMFSHSYYTLSIRQQFADGRNRPVSNYPPRALGSGGAPLMKKILTHHNGVRLSEPEARLVRLWLETGAAYPGTYAALGTGMIGGYAQNRIDRSDTRWPEMKAAMAAQARRCGACHKRNTRRQMPTSPTDNMGMPPWAIRYNHPMLRYSRHILYNLTRPDKSLLLLAPLAKSAGGYALCHPHVKKGQPQPPGEAVFAGTDDADYQALLLAVRRTAAELDRVKRFDMPGFRPRAAWVREMQRYGILPADLAPDAPLDPYAIEQRYWKSLWWQPRGRVAGLPARQ